MDTMQGRAQCKKTGSRIHREDQTARGLQGNLEA